MRTQNGARIQIYYVKSPKWTLSSKKFIFEKKKGRTILAY